MTVVAPSVVCWERIVDEMHEEMLVRKRVTKGMEVRVCSAFPE